MVGLGIEQQQAATGAREKRYWLLHAPHFFVLFKLLN
jgi:hypothetical protein